MDRHFTILDMRSRLSIFLIITSSLILNGCGGGSSSSDDTGDFTLNITDSQIDHATAVVVEFTGVTLKLADGSAIEFVFDKPMSIDLLALAGMTDSQVQQIHQQIDEAPAGGSTLIMVILLLVITELLGYTDIIPDR